MEVQVLSSTVYERTMLRHIWERPHNTGKAEASAQSVVRSVLPTAPVMSQFAY